MEDLFGTDAVTPQADGTLEAVVRWPIDEWVAGFLLGLGPEVEVVSPPGLRETIGQRAARTAARYRH